MALILVSIGLMFLAVKLYRLEREVDKIYVLLEGVISMANFLATQLIAGRLSWETLTKSKTYGKYADMVVDVLESRGYMIDEEGNCVRIPPQAKD